MRHFDLFAEVRDPSEYLKDVIKHREEEAFGHRAQVNPDGSIEIRLLPDWGRTVRLNPGRWEERGVSRDFTGAGPVTTVYSVDEALSGEDVTYNLGCREGVQVCGGSVGMATIVGDFDGQPINPCRESNLRRLSRHLGHPWADFTETRLSRTVWMSPYIARGNEAKICIDHASVAEALPGSIRVAWEKILELPTDHTFSVKPPLPEDKAPWSLAFEALYELVGCNGDHSTTRASHYFPGWG